MPREITRRCFPTSDRGANPVSHSTNTPATTHPSNKQPHGSLFRSRPALPRYGANGSIGWKGGSPLLATTSTRFWSKKPGQAMKSRHFALTLYCYCSAAGSSPSAGSPLSDPAFTTRPQAAPCLTAYYMVLIFPLVVVVPFSAFRSLSAERDENTYDLLRVSSLTPRQIITGKLASSIVQMGVYFSAVAPCLAFTYLLRGIDILTIALFLSFAVLACMGLSMLGLLAAATTQKNRGQIFSRSDSSHCFLVFFDRMRSHY